MKGETGLERIAGSLPVELGATIIASLAGGPAAALLPVLTNTLASGRHQARVKDALDSLEQELQKVRGDVDKITDAQYKFISETTLSILHSPDDQKVEYLKSAIVGALDVPDISMHDAVLSSRIVRDMSVSELKFVLDYIGSIICTDSDPQESEVQVDTKEGNFGSIISGLQSLGLLTTVQGMVFGVTDRYYFTPLARTIAEIFSSES